jgi:hypothetical protein
MAKQFVIVEPPALFQNSCMSASPGCAKHKQEEMWQIVPAESKTMTKLTGNSEIERDLKNKEKQRPQARRERTMPNLMRDEFVRFTRYPRQTSTQHSP